MFPLAIRYRFETPQTGVSTRGGTAAVRMVGDVGIIIGQCSLTLEKTIYGAKSVKMLLHQLWGAEEVKQCSGPQYNHRNTNLRFFGTILVVVIEFKCI